ncbi:MAG: 1-acyl-sn-glycerol-3-phosphate acyltransferase [Marinifilaceae bacterium]|nr:1-acyl-sn-glycerol-3-phosphate acyltransferase [Marinifilaceae bacterium]
MRLIYILAIRISYNNKYIIPNNRPLIIVSNHQGAYDIPPIFWIFRKHWPKFIAKKELGKGIPSVSYNLKKSGSALIDRKNRYQSIEEIVRLGKLIHKTNTAAAIFPEGTRSKTGKMRKFKTAGIKSLIEQAPNALIVPFAINGNYKIESNGMFPLNIGTKVEYTVLEPIEPSDFESIESMVETCQNRIQEIIDKQY